MFSPLFITACLSAIALVSSRPENPAANAIAEVKREAETLTHSGRQRGSSDDSSEEEESQEYSLSNPLGYGCWHTVCWRKCNPRNGPNDWMCDDLIERFDPLPFYDKKCFVDTLREKIDGCSRTEDCAAANQWRCSEIMEPTRIGRYQFQYRNSNSETLAHGLHHGSSLPLSAGGQSGLNQ